MATPIRRFMVRRVRFRPRNAGGLSQQLDLPEDPACTNEGDQGGALTASQHACAASMSAYAVAIRLRLVVEAHPEVRTFVVHVTREDGVSTEVSPN